MQLNRLRLLRTPGIRIPFELEPKPGLNVLTGPNGVGKSSVCRAVLSLLWPDLVSEEPFEAQAEFSRGSDLLRVTRQDLEPPVWENGNRPNLGPPHLAGRYLLGVLDLLAPDPLGDPLAKEIRHHMAGGFDLGGVRNSLFSLRTGRSENSDLKKAAEIVTRLKSDQQSLAFEQNRLKDLETEKELAGRARKRLASLEDLRSLIRETEAHTDAVSRLDKLPDACAVVRPEDPGRLNSLRNQERDHLKEIEKRIAALGTISRQKDELKNSGGLDATVALSLLKQKLGDLVELKRDLRQAEREAPGSHLDEVAAMVKPSLLPPLLMILGGAVLIAAGNIIPLPGPYLAWILVALGGGIAGAGVWGWFNFARSAHQVRIAREQETLLAQKLDHLDRCRGQLNDALLDFNATLATAGIDPLDGIDEAAHLLDDLADRRGRLQTLDTEYRTHGEFLARERVDLERVTTEVKVILDRLHLKNEPGADAEAARLLDLLPQFEKATQGRDDASREIERLTKRLAEKSSQLRPDENSTMSETVLTERIDTEVMRGEEYGNLVKEIADIEARVAVTSKEYKLQEALAAAEAAATALTGAREENREAALGRLLLDRVEQQHEKESRPLVLETADAYFRLFTRQTHGLKMAARSDGNDRFQAVAEHSAQPLELGELSDGTRAQLLLAVKLAFMTVGEDGARPPIFLDDSLTSADPGRFSAVVASLGQLAASEGRQVFYLTPNPSDTASIQRALSEAGLDPAHQIDLGLVRGLAEMTDPTLYDPTNLPNHITAPDPAGLTASEYAAALLVPRPDPWAPRGMLHVFHLLEDRLDLVRRLVDGNAATVGKFVFARKSLTAAKVITGDEAELVAAYAEIWSAWLDGWRLGRARPVPRIFLKSSNAVSGKFIAPVSAALETCGWDGAGLLDAIEAKKVKGFRSTKLEELRQELDEAGLLAHGAPLTDDELISHTRDRVTGLMASGILDMQKVRTFALTFARLIEN